MMIWMLCLKWGMLYTVSSFIWSQRNLKWCYVVNNQDFPLQVGHFEWWSLCVSQCLGEPMTCSFCAEKQKAHFIIVGRSCHVFETRSLQPFFLEAMWRKEWYMYTWIDRQYIRVDDCANIWKCSQIFNALQTWKMRKVHMRLEITYHEQLLVNCSSNALCPRHTEQHQQISMNFHIH